MRRLPGILLLTGAALVVIAALLVSGLRIALPHLDAWRPEILNKIESATGMPVEASQLSASWQNFGPTLEAHDIRAELKDGGEFSVIMLLKDGHFVLSGTEILNEPLKEAGV